LAIVGVQLYPIPLPQISLPVVSQFKDHNRDVLVGKDQPHAKICYNFRFSLPRSLRKNIQDFYFKENVTKEANKEGG